MSLRPEDLENLRLPPSPSQIDAHEGRGGGSGNPRFFTPGRPASLRRSDTQNNSEVIRTDANSIDQPLVIPPRVPRERYVPSHLNCMPENLSWALGLLLAGAALGQMLLIEYINRQQMKDMKETHIVGWDRVIYSFCFALSLALLTVNYCCSVYRSRMNAQEERRRLIANGQAAQEPKVPAHLNCMPESLAWAASFLIGGAGLGDLGLTEEINDRQMKDMQKTHIIGWNRLIYSLCLLLALSTLIANYVYSVRKAKKEENRLNLNP